jgi:hypothetical protein
MRVVRSQELGLLLESANNEELNCLTATIVALILGSNPTLDFPWRSQLI